MSRDWVLSVAIPLAVMLVSLGTGVIVDGATATAAARDRITAPAESAPARPASGLAGVTLS